MEDQSPQNKIRVWSVELMFSINTQGPDAQIILSSIIPHLSRNSGYLLKTESKSYQLKRKKEKVWLTFPNVHIEELVLDENLKDKYCK